MERIRNVLELVRGQLWPVPALFALLAAGFAYVMLYFGHELTPADPSGRWWHSGDAGTARDLLASLLSGLMSMTSLVISVTFVILTLAANQLGPRLIAIFMGDRQIQSVIGLFIGTILYVILVLRTLDENTGAEAVPHLAVTAASLLTIICLLALLFYIHKIARSIIADNVVEELSRESLQLLQEIFPDESEPEREDEEQPATRAWSIGLGKRGYLQVVDYGRLVAVGCEADVRIEVKVRAGHYLLEHGQHVVVYAADPPDDELEHKLRSAFTIGTERTAAQDPEHGLRHLVEIATRALSPGTNDPFTAIAVIHRLGAIVEQAFAGNLQQRQFRDEDGVWRVCANRTDVSGLLSAALHPIRQAGAAHPAILIQIAAMLANLAWAAKNEGQRDALLAQLARLSETTELGRFSESDRHDIVHEIGCARAILLADLGDRVQSDQGVLMREQMPQLPR